MIPKGVEHCPVAGGEVRVMLPEPKSIPNAGQQTTERRVKAEWIWAVSETATFHIVESPLSHSKRCHCKRCHSELVLSLSKGGAKNLNWPATIRFFGPLHGPQNDNEMQPGSDAN